MGTPKTDIPSEAIGQVIHIWIHKMKKEATLERLLIVMEKMGSLGVLMSLMRQEMQGQF